MLFSLVTWLALGSSLTVLATATTGIEPSPAFQQFESNYQEFTKGILSKGSKKACTKDNIVVRRAWHAMAAEERRDYIRAVKCLHQKPSRADPRRAPGNRNRRDDYTYSHIIMTLKGLLLPWHRYFIWAYEKSLREECGYRGAQPYWDFARWSDEPLASPLFDGSDTSLGGNGARVPQETGVVPMPGMPHEFDIPLPPGTGGGCVETGPFARMTVSLGPVTSARPPKGDTYGLRYNPRCLRRNFLPSISREMLTWENVTGLLGARDINVFRPQLDDVTYGIHGAMHGTIGGDAVDSFASCVDPAFYFIHAEVDRLWSIWQAQDWANRRNALNGTQSFMNIPPSPVVTTETVMDMLYAGGRVAVSEVMSTVDGPFCYKYE